MSRKSTETRRRSVPSELAGTAAVAASIPGASGNRVPQLPQNRASPMRSAPQTAHVSAKAAQQLMQNATPSGFGVPQARQFMALRAFGAGGPRILPTARAALSRLDERAARAVGDNPTSLDADHSPERRRDEPRVVADRH